MLSVILLIVDMLIVYKLIVILPNFILLNVVAPHKQVHNADTSTFFKAIATFQQNF
jgi:hypothetical protein